MKTITYSKEKFLELLYNYKTKLQKKKEELDVEIERHNQDEPLFKNALDAALRKIYDDQLNSDNNRSLAYYILYYIQYSPLFYIKKTNQIQIVKKKVKKQKLIKKKYWFITFTITCDDNDAFVEEVQNVTTKESLESFLERMNKVVEGDTYYDKIMFINQHTTGCIGSGVIKTNEYVYKIKELETSIERIISSPDAQFTIDAVQFHEYTR